MLQVRNMTQRRPKQMVVQIDMTPDGEIHTTSLPRQPASGGVGRILLRAAILIAALAGAGALAALTLSIALALLPVAIGAGLIAYGMIRYRLWRGRA